MDDRDRQLDRRRARRRKNELIMKCVIAFLILLIIICAVILVRSALIPGIKKYQEKQASLKETQETAGQEEKKDTSSGGSSIEDASQAQIEQLIAQADFLASQYDYDAAIDLLQASEYYTGSQEMEDAVSTYRSQRDDCVSYPLDEVTHVFFHTMIWDSSKAFDGDSNEAGYNQVMTTMSEFTAMMEAMYEEGYVMVSLHDMCTVNEDGTVSKGEILLPADKKPFVLSQDDVSYYHYMDGDGFAQKLIVDENGDVKNTYVEDDGSISVGDYDMVPWIDTFVKEHPDFSYHGHKGILALTGYEGILGYRTDEVYLTKDASRMTEYQQKFFEENPDFDEAAWQNEVDEATKVADAMKAEGWEFASHTWGHISPKDNSMETVETDSQRWHDYVESIVGDTDVLIFAFGADIGDWQPYSSDNEYFSYYKSMGFSIFCNVDASTTHWVQFGDDFMRQGRRNLDGYRMYYTPELISDLFDVDSVWDASRPTPVPAM